MSDLIPPVLIAMPGNVMRIILEKCDYVSIQCLRKTCHDLRNFIDDNKPKLRIEEIVIYHYLNKIELSFRSYALRGQYPEGEGVYLTYRKRDGEKPKIIWERSDGIREKIIENEKYTNAFIRDFASILSFRLPILEQFSIRTYVDDLETIRKAFEYSESSGNSPLKVRELVMMRTNGAEDVMDVLPYLCPVAIQNLYIEHTRGTGVAWDFTKVVELEQWKNSEELDMNVNTVRGVRIEDYHHFRTAQVRLEKVTADDIVKVKENFLNSSSTRKDLRLIAEKSFPDPDQLKAFLGQYYVDEDKWKYWFFRRQDKKIVRISTGGRIADFDIKSSKDVPKGARVIG